MNTIDFSQIQLAALRSSCFAASKLQKTFPSSFTFSFFEFSSLVEGVPCVEAKEFFAKMENRTAQFFMEWFSADNALDFAVRRRVALQAVKDVVDANLWDEISVFPAVTRVSEPVAKLLESYEKQIKKNEKVTALFPVPLSDKFYKQYRNIRQAMSQGGVVGCGEDVLLDSVHQLFAEKLTARINQILPSIGSPVLFKPSAPWAAKNMEKRIANHRAKNEPVTISPPPVREPVLIKG